MKFLGSKTYIYLFIVVFLFQSIFFALYADAAFEVKTVKVLKNNNICLQNASGLEESLDLSTLTTNSDSVNARLTSSGALCSPPPFFTGGVNLKSVNSVKTQAQPVVQAFSRGILISEIAGDSGGVSSSGQPTGFNDLALSFGGVNNLFFEVTLPPECDVIDDDDDAIGSQADLTTVNDFSFPTCSATGGLSVSCNTATGLIMVMNVLEPASGGNPAKIRFLLTATGSLADINMIDSILLNLDSQDIFCPDVVTGPLNTTVFAKKESLTSPTTTQTLGTIDLGSPTKAATLSYATETAISTQGETSTNQIGTVAILAPGSQTIANKVEITEVASEGIPISSISSAANINPDINQGLLLEEIHIFITPSKLNLFSEAPSSMDVAFSDNSLVLKSDPVLVSTSADHASAPFGSIVLKVGKNPALGATDPSKIKTTISISNLKLRGIGEAEANTATDSTISLTFFEPNSGALINTPGVLSLFTSGDITNPQNFSAFSPNSTRAIRQNEVVGGAVNALEGANRIQTDQNLSDLTTRNTELGTPQILTFTKVVKNLTPIDEDKISIVGSSLVFTVTGSAGASIPGAKVTVSLQTGDTQPVFDSVIVTSQSDGSFNAKLKGSSTGQQLVKIKQTVSGSESTLVELATPSGESGGGLSCEQTVCGCENPDCTPVVSNIVSFIDSNGGLSSIVSQGGALLNEVISSIKKALGLT